MGFRGSYLRQIGPGLVIAATGLGAGDLIAASVAGARYGTVLLWAALIGALMKYVMNEGLARWQLATGSTLLEGIVRHLPKAVSTYFFAYLLLWTFFVAAALIAAAGLAAHSLYPGLTVTGWGIIHSLGAAVLVVAGRYRLLELLMKLAIALMMVVVMVCAVWVAPDSGALLSGLVPTLPEGSVLFVFGVIGGVGGSVTLLCYGYWMYEHGWKKHTDMPRVRVDLGIAYLLTALFGVAIMVVAAGLHPESAGGNRLVLHIAEQLGAVAGPAARWCFLAGFWSAVFSSMLGVWQGIPYLFADFVRLYTGQTGAVSAVDTGSMAYRGYLAYIAIPPMIMLLAEKPVWLVLIYAVAGAFFMPLLGLVLLTINNRSALPAGLRNGPLSNLLLSLSVAVFALLLYSKIAAQFGAG